MKLVDAPDVAPPRTEVFAPAAVGWAHHIRTERLVAGVICCLVLLLVAVPLATLLFSSVRSTANRLPFEATGFTLANYAQVFLSPRTYELLRNTIGYTIGAVVLGLLIATLFAWLLERTNLPTRRLAYACVLAPMGMPPMMLALAWILLASPSNGALNLLLRPWLGGVDQGPFDVYSIPGMVVVSALGFVPSMYLMIASTFRHLDPALEEAAQVAGAGPWQVLRRVLLPLVRPGLLAAAIYFTVVLVGAFDIPAFLGLTAGIHVFSTSIYLAAHPAAGLPDYGLASTYGVFLLALALALILWYRRQTRQVGAFATVTGRGYRLQIVDLGRWRYVALSGVVAYLAVAVLLPLGILVWASLLPFYAPPSGEALRRLSGENYLRVWHYPGIWDIARSTGILLLSTATLTVALALITAWLAVRGKSPLSALPDTIGFLNVGVPGIILALGVLFAALSLPVPLYGTLAAIVFALVAHYLPFGSRVIGAALLQMHRELEEAAAVSGAAWVPTLRRIVVPLLLPALVNAWLWVAVHAVRELSIPLLLYNRGNAVLATLIWSSFEQEARIGFAAVLGVLLIALSISLALVGRGVLVDTGSAAS